MFYFTVAKELHVLQKADYLWSMDGYIRRDHTAILGQAHVASTSDILTPSGSPLVVVPGRDGKGRAVEVDGAADRWLALGEYLVIEFIRFFFTGADILNFSH